MGCSLVLVLGSFMFFRFLNLFVPSLDPNVWLASHFPAKSWPGYWPCGSTSPNTSSLDWPFPSRYPAQCPAPSSKILSPSSFLPSESITIYVHILTTDSRLLTHSRFHQPRTHPDVCFLVKISSVMAGSNRCACILSSGFWQLVPSPNF